MERERFDLVHLDSIHMVRYALAARTKQASLKAIYNWHNIESEAMRRYGATTSSPARRLYAGFTAGKLERLESRILHSEFGHIVCSARERQQLLDIAPKARVAVVDNGVDVDYFGQGVEAAATTTAQRIVFVGTMDYFPNSDAAIFFANQIWPHARAVLPGVEFTIVGANP